MPRQRRADEAGAIYHALNRGNGRQVIFHKSEDYEAFLRVLGEGLEFYEVELFSFTLMPSHWHLVLRPAEDGGMGRLLRWVSATHTLRYHAHYGKRGEGHLYQGRYKSFPVQDDAHFLSLCRYVERNPVRAGLVKSAESWKYGSLHRRGGREAEAVVPLATWPIRRPANWSRRVDEPLADSELAAIRVCVERGRPYGDDGWVRKTAEHSGLAYTLRPIGRPRKNPPRPKWVPAAQQTSKGPPSR